MVQAYTFAQILKAAGKDLTRKKLVETLETNPPKGPALVPYAYSKESHSGYTGAFVFRINPDGTETTIQPPMVTDRENGPVSAAEENRLTPEQADLLSK